MLTFRSKLCATWFVALVDALVRVFHPRASRRARLRFVVPVARNCRPLVVTEAVTGVVVLPRRREILPAARCRLRRARGLVVHFFAREWQGRVAAHAAFCIVLAFLEFCAHILFPRQISAHWVTAGFRAALATAPFGIAVAVFAVVQVAPWLGAIVDGVVLVRVADGAAVAAAAVPVACIVVVAAVAGGGPGLHAVVLSALARAAGAFVPAVIALVPRAPSSLGAGLALHHVARRLFVFCPAESVVLPVMAPVVTMRVIGTCKRTSAYIGRGSLLPTSKGH